MEVQGPVLGPAGHQYAERDRTTAHSIVESGPDDSPRDDEYKLGVWNRFLSAVGWYPKAMPAVEKSLVLRLDLIILVFGCLSFFTKYLDQAAITNAYVS
jgi:ACS family pantothenate transporter-like MFS transporter